MPGARRSTADLRPQCVARGDHRRSGHRVARGALLWRDMALAPAADFHAKATMGGVVHADYPGLVIRATYPGRLDVHWIPPIRPNISDTIDAVSATRCAWAAQPQRWCLPSRGSKSDEDVQGPKASRKACRLKSIQGSDRKDVDKYGLVGVTFGRHGSLGLKLCYRILHSCVKSGRRCGNKEPLKKTNKILY